MAGAKPLSVKIREAIQADWARNPWYRHGEALFNPSLPDMRRHGAIEEYLLSGWAPPSPFITPQTKISFVGGCFGGALAEHLRRLAYSAPGDIDTTFIPINETLCTTSALRQLFAWCFEGVKPDPALVKGNRALEINFSDDLWSATLAPLKTTNVFVLLLSTAEVWEDEPTGAVLWREVPGANPSRQKFRITSAAENLSDLREIHRLISSHRPDAKIIFTLSPIPMIATHRRESSIAANIVAKAVVRVALDELYREVVAQGRSFYFPFYEVALEGFGATPYGGHFNGDRRHVNDVLLDYVKLLFESLYCDVSCPSRSVFQEYVKARIDTGDLPAPLIEMADRADRRGLQHMIDDFERQDDQPTAELVARYAAERLNLDESTDPAEPWRDAGLAWQVLPGMQWVGSAPQTLPIPATAWDYGATSGPLQAGEDEDLLVRITLRVREGRVGVMLMRPDGSALSARDQPIAAGDDAVDVELQIYPQDGLAHVLLRNYDNDGVPGKVEIEAIATRTVRPEPPKLRK